MAERIVSTANSAGEHPPTALRPRRIAFCITDLDVGGAERMFVELVTRLDRQHWEPRVFCLSRKGALVEQLQRVGIPVVCLGATSLRDIGVIWRLARELKQFAPQLLQCFLFHANMAGRIAAWWARVPRVVCGIRVAERRSRVPLLLDRWTQFLVDHNVCVSRAVAEFSSNVAKIHRNKLSVIPNAVDAERFASTPAADRASLEIPFDVPLVLFVGRLDPQKAPLTLLEAFGRLLERHENWQLLYLGDGPLRSELESEIARQKCSRNVRVAGWRPDVAEWLRAADVLALPSLWEGMPNIVLEAMASGLPVVVSRVEGTDELVQHGETGFLVEPGSASDLESQLEMALSNPGISRRTAKSAQLFVNEKFTFRQKIASYDSLYRDLLSQ